MHTKAGSWSQALPAAGGSPALDPKPITVQATFQDDSACGQQGLRRLYFRACGLPRLIDTLTLLRLCQTGVGGRKALRLRLFILFLTTKMSHQVGSLDSEGFSLTDPRASSATAFVNQGRESSSCCRVL